MIEAHFSVVNKVELNSGKSGGKGSSLSQARDKFAQLWGPLATLNRNATRNAGTRGREAMSLTKVFDKALKNYHG